MSLISGRLWRILFLMLKSDVNVGKFHFLLTLISRWSMVARVVVADVDRTSDEGQLS